VIIRFYRRDVNKRFNLRRSALEVNLQTGIARPCYNAFQFVVIYHKGLINLFMNLVIIFVHIYSNKHLDLAS
jgi:hypothetical protein